MVGNLCNTQPPNLYKMQVRRSHKGRAIRPGRHGQRRAILCGLALLFEMLVRSLQRAQKRRNLVEKNGELAADSLRSSGPPQISPHTGRSELLKKGKLARENPDSLKSSDFEKWFNHEIFLWNVLKCSRMFEIVVQCHDMNYLVQSHACHFKKNKNITKLCKSWFLYKMVFACGS